MDENNARIKAALTVANDAHDHGQRIRQKMLDGDFGMTPEEQRSFWEGFNLGLRYISRIKEHLQGGTWEARSGNE